MTPDPISQEQYRERSLELLRVLSQPTTLAEIERACDEAYKAMVDNVEHGQNHTPWSVRTL